MPKPLPIPEGAAEQLRLELKKSRTKEHYRRALAVWMRVALGMPAHKIARILDWSPETVRLLQRRFLREGAVVLEGSGRWGGRRRANMTQKAEREFLSKALEETRPNAVIDARFIQEAYEKRVGHAVADTVIYRLLRRHGWRRLTEGRVLTARWAASRVPKGSGPAANWSDAWPTAGL
jgi:transposase